MIDLHRDLPNHTMNEGSLFATRVQGAFDLKGITNADGRMDAHKSARLVRRLGKQTPYLAFKAKYCFLNSEAHAYENAISEDRVEQL